MQKITHILLILFVFTVISRKPLFGQDQNSKAKAQYFLGTEKFEQKKYEQALSHFNQAISILGKTNARIAYYKIKSYKALEQNDVCQKEIKTYLNSQPKQNDWYKEIIMISADIRVKTEKIREEKAKAKRLAIANKLKEDKKAQAAKDEAQRIENLNLYAIKQHKQLVKAIKANDTEEIAYLIQRGAQVDQIIYKSETDITNKNPEGEVLRRLYDDYDLPIYFKSSSTKTHLFCFRKLHWEKRKALLNHRLPSNYERSYLNYIIMQAQWSKSKTYWNDDKISGLVKELIDLGADPNVRDHYSSSLRLAWENNLPKTADVLKKQGATSNFAYWNNIKNCYNRSFKVKGSQYQALSAYKDFAKGINQDQDLMLIENLKRIKKSLSSKLILYDGFKYGKSEEKSCTPLYLALQKNKFRIASKIYALTKNYTGGKISVYSIKGDNYQVRTSPVLHSVFQLAIEKNQVNLVKNMALDGAKWNTGGKSQKLINNKWEKLNNLELAESYASPEMLKLLQLIKSGNLN